MIYFDNSATTSIYPEVLDTYIKTSKQIMGNPSSLHSLGSQANRLLEQSRKQISELLSVQSQEIYFTSGGTEGNNWVLKGTAIEKQVFGKHIIISAIEHPAIAETAHQLKQLGFEISYAPVDKNGRVIVEQLAELIRKDTILVSIMAVNNEVGSIQPIQEISELLNDFPTVHFHVDAVQAIGKLPKELWLTPRVDFATISAHKFHGPRGIGFIYWKNGRKLAPLLNGGGQEKNQRSGTENLPAIVAMAKALRLYMAKIERQPNHMTTLKNYFVDALEEYNKVTIFSKKGNLFIPNILCFALKGVRGEAFVHALEEKQIYVSTTSACSSKKKIISSTLSAMKFPNDLATSAIRVSLDEDNTMAEIEQFMIIFHQLYKKFSKINS
ncbi:cysteine desulfurase family protein [Melissococcus plutonius]|uniref:Cysteine desulfurase n=1 Tax=Melissococcus plutonius (strain ATCC 35311 / DSM 29964 / CIP 104052 / LMG 20360 / NCIMB 702443) TaxID=940190 RepID=F3Y844_MELPT|nr:cysteine desulfurase family protein [Melissococcus plutonius]AIM24418.1 NifS/IcsS-like protein [Melissococcus plutonius S1]KMT25812.1 NifS/IcsS-like protein [Melissococcus plutonius]KMT27157.1 NifS/IcsS-like protein [Melissococcus plutonius]KMT28258.1 NifS/IcsS-like protein [Melissococcus plutonius]KMT29995.1 NifS/IcsS-like protein [Melissococcus plutonius]